MPPQMDDDPSAPGNAADAPDPAAEFNAALNEAIAAQEAPAQAAAAESWEDPGQAAAEPGDQAPADAAALGEPASGVEPQAGGQPQDIWADAPQHLRDAYQASLRDAELRVRSVAGRHSHLERELQALRQQVPSGQQAPGTQEQGGQPSSDTASNDAIRQLREDYPEVAGPLIDLIAQQQARIDQLSQPVQQMQQQQAAAFVTEQEQFLTSQVPDWQDAVRDDRFVGWLQMQPPAIREAFQKNVDNIVDGADAALVVSQFKAAVGFAAPQQVAPTPAKQPDQRRSRQLAAGVDVAANGPSASNIGPDEQDFDGNLAYFLAKAEQQVATR